MSFRNSLNHFFKVASFAIDNLWPVGRVAGLEGIRAALGHTLACPEAQGVALLEPLVVAAVGASTGQRQVHSAIKSKLGLNDFECFCALRDLPRRSFSGGGCVRALNNFANDVVWDIFDVVG